VRRLPSSSGLGPYSASISGESGRKTKHAVGHGKAEICSSLQEGCSRGANSGCAELLPLTRRGALSGAPMGVTATLITGT